MDLRITVSDLSEKVILTLAGQFDFNAHRIFRDAYTPYLEKEAKVIEFDLAEVSHIDSAALGMLLLLKEKVNNAGKKLILLHCRGTVLDILKVANFHNMFTMQ